MTAQGIRLLIFCFVVLGFATGCAGVPPVPDKVKTRPPGAVSLGSEEEKDEYEGWLFRRMTGQETPDPSPKASSQVVQASSTEPISAISAVPPSASEPEEDAGFSLSDMAPENVVKKVKKAAGYGPNEGIARALLEEGEALFKEKKYGEAGDKFKAAANRWPESTLEEDAMFLLGECYFFSDRYPKAQDAYDNLLKEYDNSRHLDTTVKRLFAIGQYWEELHEAEPHWPVTPNMTDKKRPRFDTFGNALKAYESVRLKDPIGPLADDSLMATANAYFRKGRFEDAAYYYDMLRKEYPKSEHQVQAHVLGVQSKLRVYQGQLYDGTPLNQADEVAEQTLIQFGGELGPEQSRLKEARTQVLEEKAARDWAVGQFYDNRKQYGAARFYYRSVIKDYPLSQAAARARQRLVQIQDQPDTPPNRFRWLTDIFPAEE